MTLVNVIWEAFRVVTAAVVVVEGDEEESISKKVEEQLQRAKMKERDVKMKVEEKTLPATLHHQTTKKADWNKFLKTMKRKKWKSKRNEGESRFLQVRTHTHAPLSSFNVTIDQKMMFLMVMIIAR
uniref:S ribonuclease n=1 Tax=Loa loa TaxID=7209 RepID=A0A1I7VKG0_LOALO